MRVLVVSVCVLVAVGCSQTALESPVAPSGLESSMVNASEPPYGEYHTLGHAGSEWSGIVPGNPCGQIWGGSGHLHTSSTEAYDDLTEAFLGWVCQGGMEHIDGSVVSILD